MKIVNQKNLKRKSNKDDLEGELWDLGYEIIDLFSAKLGIKHVIADMYLASLDTYEYEPPMLEKIIKMIDKKFKVKMHGEWEFWARQPLILLAMYIKVQHVYDKYEK